MVLYLKFFITITKHIKMYMVEKLEMLMLCMYHMGDLTLERLAYEYMVQMCGTQFQPIFRDLNPLQYSNIDYDVTWLIGS